MIRPIMRECPYGRRELGADLAWEEPISEHVRSTVLHVTYFLIKNDEIYNISMFILSHDNKIFLGEEASNADERLRQYGIISRTYSAPYMTPTGERATSA